jgi:hypothetical protein
MTMPDRPASDSPIAANATFRSRPSFGFICRSSTEVGRVLEIARSLENGCIVIGRKSGRRKGSFGAADPIFEIEESVFTDSKVPVVVWSENRMWKLDGFFDVIICQTPIAGIEEFKESRVVTSLEGSDCRAIIESSMNSISRE